LEGIKRRGSRELFEKSGGATARNSAATGVDMRVALTYCLLKIPRNGRNPSSFLPSFSDEAAFILSNSGDGFKDVNRAGSARSRAIGAR